LCNHTKVKIALVFFFLAFYTFFGKHPNGCFYFLKTGVFAWGAK
jgi:hypothetical protein